MQTLRLSLSRVCSLGVMTILSRFCRGRGHQGVGVRGRGGGAIRVLEGRFCSVE